MSRFTGAHGRAPAAHTVPVHVQGLFGDADDDHDEVTRTLTTFQNNGNSLPHADAHCAKRVPRPGEVQLVGRRCD